MTKNRETLKDEKQYKIHITLKDLDKLSKMPDSGREWSKEDDAVIIKYYNKGAVELKHLAAITNRTYSGVRYRINVLKMEGRIQG